MSSSWIDPLIIMQYPSLSLNILYFKVYFQVDEPEPIIQTEVSHKEKGKYHILTHLYGIQKDNAEEFFCMAEMEKQTQKTDLWTQGGGETGRCMQRVTWKLTLPYVKWIANGNFLYVSGNSNRGSVSTQMDGMGKEIERRFNGEGHMYTYS